MWTGTLSFGLVSVPVKMYNAVTSKTVRFHQLHAGDHGRIRNRHVCEADGEDVAFSEIVKGYEIAPERYVIVSTEELAALEPAFTRSIDIEDFVEPDQIDPIYLDHPYYLVPGTGGARSYRILLEAMQRTGKVAIARVVLRSRERLVTICPRENVLLMRSMHYGDELQPTNRMRELDGIARTPAVERELGVACRLVESIAEDFDIDRYRDNFREAVLDLIDRKASGEEVVIEPPRKRPTFDAPDLITALQASLEDARRRPDAASNGNGRADEVPVEA
jgi:DNA end-binding protein Ku